MRALAIAATGMSAQQLNLEVIANNIANINTTGFKRARAEFADLLYQNERTQGVATRGDESLVPEGANLGLGVRPVAIRNLHIQGTLASTGNKLDLALNGRGFFEISGPNGAKLYSRAGSFNTSASGEIVTADGYPVQPSLVVPPNTLTVTVSASGAVTAQIDGQTAPQSIGQLTLANFANEAGLDPLGGNLYAETAASGAAVTGVPGSAGFATIQQGYLENSNVDSVKEITELISAQRAYEMNSKVIQAADEMASIANKSMR